MLAQRNFLTGPHTFIAISFGLTSRFGSEPNAIKAVPKLFNCPGASLSGAGHRGLSRPLEELWDRSLWSRKSPQTHQGFRSASLAGLSGTQHHMEVAPSDASSRKRPNEPMTGRARAARQWREMRRIAPPANRTTQFIQGEPGLGGLQGSNGLPHRNAHQIEAGDTKQTDLSGEGLIRFALLRIERRRDASTGGLGSGLRRAADCFEWHPDHATRQSVGSALAHRGKPRWVGHRQSEPRKSPSRECPPRNWWSRRINHPVGISLGTPSAPFRALNRIRSQRGSKNQGFNRRPS